jgi:putative FmdB family regulatory protein
MPIYEYECTPCRVIYETRQSLKDAPLETCPRCGQRRLIRLLSAPNLNRGNHSSPTEAKYGRMSVRDEITREKILQEDYDRIWLPPPVKHSPWDGWRSPGSIAGAEFGGPG